MQTPGGFDGESDGNEADWQQSKFNYLKKSNFYCQILLRNIHNVFNTKFIRNSIDFNLVPFGFYSMSKTENHKCAPKVTTFILSLKKGQRDHIFENYCMISKIIKFYKILTKDLFNEITFLT